MRVQHNRAFTLVEMLVVMAIIVLMASALVVTVQGVRTRAAVHAAKAQVAGIQMAVEDHKSKFGHYPEERRLLYASNPAQPSNLDRCLTVEQKLAAFLWRAGYEYREEQDIVFTYVYDNNVPPPNNMLHRNADGSRTSSFGEALMLPVLVDIYGGQIGFAMAGQAYRIYSLGPDMVTASNDGLDNDGDTLVDAENDPDEGALDGMVGDDIMP